MEKDRKSCFPFYGMLWRRIVNPVFPFMGGYGDGLEILFSLLWDVMEKDRKSCFPLYGMVWRLIGNPVFPCMGCYGDG